MFAKCGPDDNDVCLGPTSASAFQQASASQIVESRFSLFAGMLELPGSGQGSTHVQAREQAGIKSAGAEPVPHRGVYAEGNQA